MRLLAPTQQHQDVAMADPDALRVGLDRYERGEWSAAVVALGALDRRPPHADEALANARWWLDDPKGAIASWEDAYRGYAEEGDASAAGRIAVTISREYTSALGNPAAANGWLVRARGEAEGDPSVAA